MRYHKANFYKHMYTPSILDNSEVHILTGIESI
jgi:hypothetical protein